MLLGEIHQTSFTCSVDDRLFFEPALKEAKASSNFVIVVSIVVRLGVGWKETDVTKLLLYSFINLGMIKLRVGCLPPRFRSRFCHVRCRWHRSRCIAEELGWVTKISICLTVDIGFAICKTICRWLILR